MLYANLIALLLFLGETNGYPPATVTAPSHILGRSTSEEQFIGFGNQNGSGYSSYNCPLSYTWFTSQTVGICCTTAFSLCEYGTSCAKDKKTVIASSTTWECPSLEACATATVSYQPIQVSSTTISPAVFTRVGCASYKDGFTLYRQDPDLSEIYGGSGSNSGWSPSTGGDSSSSSSGLSMSDRIAIGVGLGVGITSIVIAFVAYLCPRNKKSRATTSDSASNGSAVFPTSKPTITNPLNGNIPPKPLIAAAKTM